jgi:hypothetical protein
MSLHHFLLLYDVKRQTLIDAHDLGTDGEAAADAYADAEREHRDEQGIEIVLIGADSLDTIRQTHSHYFDDAEDDFFAAVVAE